LKHIFYKVKAVMFGPRSEDPLRKIHERMLHYTLLNLEVLEVRCRGEELLVGWTGQWMRNEKDGS
jgi:hypothetical protein